MDTSLLYSTTQWLHTHPHWAYFLIFFFSFLESLALIGLVFPGIVIMTAAGILAGSQILHLTPVILFAALGSFLGDYLSYGIGYYYRENLKAIWPFRLFPKVIKKGEAFFYKHGGKSVFIGRFIGPVRPIIPLIAGSLKMSGIRFVFVDIIASILWAIVYLLPGFIIGAASLTLPHDAARRIIFNLIILMILIFIIYWILQLILVKLTLFLDKMVYRLWNFLQRHPKGHFFFNLLKATNIPEDHSQLAITLIALLLWIALIIVIISVCTHSGIYHINVPLNHFFRSAYSVSMKKIMLCITYLAKPITIGIFWLVIFAWLCFRRLWFTAIHWFLVGLLAACISDTLKLLIASPRPMGLEATPASYSFPSGHTTMSTALFSFLAIIIARDRDEYFAGFCYLFAAILCFLIGISRVYLGVHWITDVLAGFLLGLAVSLTVAISFRRQHTKQPKLIEFLLVIILSMTVLWSFNYHYSFKHDLQAFNPVWSEIKISEKNWWENGVPNTPLYRKNRLGKNVQTLNIEWLGTLPTIKTLLQQNGWQGDTKSILLHTINYFGENNRTKSMPLFSNIYQDKKPKLIMSKMIAENNSLLILSLWESHVSVIEQDAEESMPLWVGNISYIYIDKPNLFSKKIKLNAIKPIMPFALDVLMQDLNQTKLTKDSSNNTLHSLFKILNYPNITALPTTHDIGWDGRVLLVKSN